MNKKNFDGFLNSPQFNELERFSIFTVLLYGAVAVCMLFMEDVAEYLPEVTGFVALIAIFKYFLFMFWDYYNEEPLVGINSIPATLTDRYHAGAILLVEDLIKYNNETQSYEYDGFGFQDLTFALEAAMCEHIVFSNWTPEDRAKMAREVIMRYFPSHY